MNMCLEAQNKCFKEQIPYKTLKHVFCPKLEYYSFVYL